MIISKYPCKNDELILISKMVMGSFKRDITDFNDYSNLFDNKYLEEFTGMIKEAKMLFPPSGITEDIKVINKRLYKKIEDLRPEISKLEGYVKRAGDNIFIYENNFGFRELRDEIRGKNTDSLNIIMETVLQNLNNNISALKNAGLRDDHLKGIKKKIDMINADNATKALKTDERKALVEKNIEVLNRLWEIIADIMDAGKRIYRYRNKTKYKDYVMTSLKKSIRKDKK